MLTIKKRARTSPAVLAMSLFAVLGLAATGCSSSSESTSETLAPEVTTEAAVETTVAVEPFRIAVISPSAKNDSAFSQSIFDAVTRISETMEVEIQISDGLFVVEEAAKAIRGYAEDGFDLVIAHGSQYGGPLQEIAPDYPDVAFAWGTAVDTFGLANVSSYSVRADQGGYVMGVIAATLSAAKNIGVVGPVEVGDAKLFVDGFKSGVGSKDPDVKVNVNYIKSFGDVALATEAATAFVANGADVLTGTAQMVVGAIAVAKAEGIPWFGTQSNQTALAPEIVVASQVYHWEVILATIIADVKSGVLGGKTHIATLAHGGLVIEYNDAFKLDPEVKALADKTIAGLADQTINTGVK